MTEDKIKEAFEAWFKDAVERKAFLAGSVFPGDFHFAYQAGYLACLNSLEYAATLADNGKDKVAYFLPEGVAK